MAYGLDSILTSVKQQSDSIQSLEFHQPGIFTNAIITKPPITRLLKDAASHEQSLYKINKSNGGGFTSTTTRKSKSLERKGKANSTSKSNVNDEYDSHKHYEMSTIELRPERIDGKSIYIDDSFSELMNTAVSTNDDDIRRTAVRIPKMITETETTNKIPNLRSDEIDSNSSPSKSYNYNHGQHEPSNFNLIPESLILSNNINDYCLSLLDLITKYPSLVNKQNLYQDIHNYKIEYNQLLGEIESSEIFVKDQKAKLKYYNVNEFSPIREERLRQVHNEEQNDDNEDEEDDDSLENIDEFINQIQEDIANLEYELNEMTR